MPNLCNNCYYPIREKAKYCEHCGQSDQDGRIGVMTLLQDFFSDILNVDNKLWRTFGALFKPGQLTRHYFEGKQIRYASPLRLFSMAALFMFFVIGYFGDSAMAKLMEANATKIDQKIFHGTFLEEVKTESDTVNVLFGQSEQIAIALDTLYERLHHNNSDSIRVGFFATDSTGVYTQMASQDVLGMPVDSLLDHYSVESYWNRMHYRQYLRLSRQGGNFFGFILGKMVWMLLLLMPTLAFVLKLLYIRRKYYFVEHLVFSFHVHSFVFLAIAAFFLASNVMEGYTMQSLLLWISGLAVVLYPMFAMKGFYQQSRRKTFLKYCIMSFCYGILFSFYLFSTFVVSAMIY